MKSYAVMNPHAHGQWARPSLRMFILKELNAAECESLACETSLRVGGTGCSLCIKDTSLLRTLQHGRVIQRSHCSMVSLNYCSWLPEHHRPATLVFSDCQPATKCTRPYNAPSCMPNCTYLPRLKNCAPLLNLELHCHPHFTTTQTG